MLVGEGEEGGSLGARLLVAPPLLVGDPGLLQPASHRRLRARRSAEYDGRPVARAPGVVAQPLCPVGISPARAGRVRSWGSQSSGSATSAASLIRLTSVGDRPVGGLDVLAQRDPVLAQPELDLLEPAGAEELLQQPLAVLGPGAQEGLEPALGEHRDLGELGEVHPDQAADQVTGLVEAAGERHPLAVASARSTVTEACWTVVPEPRFLGRSQLGERTIRNRRPARVASSRTHGAHRGVGLVGAQPLGGSSVAGHVAVEREADRVEHAGLARAGGAGEQEEPGLGELVEVDGDGVGERPERGDLEAVQPHQDDTSSDTRVSTSAVVAAGVDRAEQQRGLVVAGGRPAHVGHEVEGDVVVGAHRARHARGASPVTGSAASKLSSSVCGNRRRSRSIACARPDLVGEGGLDPRRPRAAEYAGSLQQLLERPAQPGQRARDRGVDELGVRQTRRRPARPATSPCGGRPRRTSRRAVSRCSGSRR